MDDEKEKFRLTEWGCLYAVLKEYNIDVGHISGRVGQHIVDDFLETMVIAGYIGKADPGDGYSGDED